MRNIPMSQRDRLGATVRRALWLAAASASAAVMSPASAQQPPAQTLQLDEIVVTARKREESIQTTPVAVSAFTAEALQARNVDSIDKVSQFTPNLQFDGAAALSGGRFNATMFIRGVGQNDFATFSDAGVGMYVDGIYMGRTIGGIMDAVDIGRVEVLRGPQGTLFGKNTIGGAVNIISTAPSNDIGGTVSYTVGQFNRSDVKASVNLPLADGKFITRWSVARMARDGYGKQVDFVTGKTEERGDHNALIARVQNLWHVSDTFTASLDFDGTRAREHSAPLTLLRVAAFNNAGGYPFFNLFNNLVAPNQTAINAKLPLGVSPGMTSFWITNDPYLTYGNSNNVNNMDSWGTGLTLDWDMGTTKFKSITGYRNLKAEFGRDGDNSPYAFRQTYNIDSQHQLSQEFQLSGTSFSDKLNWLVGAYYFSEHAVDDGNENGGAQLALGVYNALRAQPVGSWSPPATAPRPTACVPTLPGPPCLGGPANIQNIGVDLQVQLHNVSDNDSYAVFSQATYKFNNVFSVTPGIRFTRDTKKFTGYQFRMNAINDFGAGIYTLPTGAQTSAYVIPDGFVIESTWNQISPKLGFEAQVTSDVLLYVSASSGFKSGGFNARPLVSTSEVNQYEPEKVMSYEVGAKTSWFDHRMVLNAAAFYSNYKDIQITVNQTPLNRVFNAAEGKIKGGEAELTTRVAAGFDINLSAGYLSTEYTEIDPATCPAGSCPITTDSTFVKAPKWTTSGGMQYTFAAGSGSHVTLRGDWAYKALVYQDVANDPAITQPGYSVFNGRISWVSGDDAWNLALFGTNLGDKRYIISGNASSAAFGSLAEATYAPPREWGVTVGYKF